MFTALLPCCSLVSSFLLPFRIAAGEVVQRPSSAIKELVENSLDAGATSISVLVKNGGLDVLQIVDDGHGIHRDDFAIVCERFTTSKLSTFDDLANIATFGFRGEALASITHVARVSILSRTSDAQCAYRAQYVDGKFSPGQEPKPAAGVVGTTITAEDLFHNMPTRRTAFKNPNDEYLRILDVLTKYSIHYARVSFTCKKHGKTTPDLHTPRDDGVAGRTRCPLDVIRIVYGASVAKELVEFQFSRSTAEDAGAMDNVAEGRFVVAATGLVSNANFSQKKSVFLLFINGRLVESAALKKVVEQVYAQYLPKHSHPFVYLALSLPAPAVDVNVHPTKREVHFLCQDRILELVYEELSTALNGSNQSRAFQVQTFVSVPPVAAAHAPPALTPQLLSQPPPPRAHIEIVDPSAMAVDQQSELPLRAVANDGNGGGPVAAHEDPAQAAAPVDIARTSAEDRPTAASASAALPSATQTHTRPGGSLDFALFRSTAASSVAPAARKRDRETPRTTAEPATQPNKMVRVDGAVQSIRAFFPRAAVPLATTDAVAFASGDEATGDAPDEEESREAAFYCGSSDLMLRQACSCCNGSASAIAQPAVPSSGAASMTTQLARRTRCPLASVQTLMAHFVDNADGTVDEAFEQQLRVHVQLVGAVDAQLSLVQSGTRLLLLRHAPLLRQLFFQAALRQFGEFPQVLTLSPPVRLTAALTPFVAAQLRHQRAAARDEDGAVSADDVAAAVRALVSVLAARADMLAEYFRVELSQDTDGSWSLTTLPVLLPGHRPLPAELPRFLAKLALQTRWDAEAPCFSDVLGHLAWYYALLRPVEGDGRELSDEARDVLSVVLFPAMKRHLRPHRSDELRDADWLLEVTSLEKLYRVFERC